MTSPGKVPLRDKTPGIGVVPLDVFYVIFMRLNFVLTNKEVELMARYWDPEVMTKNEINYRQFLDKLYK